MSLKKFGYGHSAKLKIKTMPVTDTRPEVIAFKKKIFNAYKMLIGFSVLLALLLPSNTRDISCFFALWVDFVQQLIPYVQWIEKNSNIPDLSTVWFSIIWPLIFVYLLYFMVQFPYGCAHSMIRASGLSTWKQVQMTSISVFFAFLMYWIFFDRRVAAVKISTQGYARLIEAAIIDSRMGLALGSPWLISLCIVGWAMALAFILIQAGRIFCADDEINKGN